MKKVLLLIFPTFSEFEVTVATAILRGAFELVTVGLTPDPVKSEAGFTVVPDLALADVNPADFEVLLIPGGDMIHLKDAEPLFALVRQLHQGGKLLAAICAGPYVLGRAGLLEGLPYTVTFAAEARRFLSCFPEAGFHYAPVVEAGQVITAQGHAFVEFGLAVGRRLGAIGDLEGVTAFYQGRGNKMMEVEV